MTQPRTPGSPLRLGTRRSLLAQAQSSWVARQLEALHPGLRVELVGIETRGDQWLDVPLSTAPGREFFVAELDAALLAGQVDFTVHSYKDLSLERPPDLVLAAVPQRADPRDVVLFGPSAARRLAEGLPLRIGTGAPRRITNLADFLPAALPGANPQPAPQFVPIRGNIDTRLSRVHLPESEDRHLDAVVLAMAGLARLWTSPSGSARLTTLLAGVRWMILPLSECPTAPAQGALAIECRANDADMRRYLAAMHHPATAQHVDRERRVLAEWGGGCHQALGATSISVPSVGSVLHVRGRKPDGAFLAEQRVDTHAPDAVSTPTPPSEVAQPIHNPELAVFLPKASSTTDVAALDGKRVWTGDLEGWLALARCGVWVEGCAEGLGLASLRSLFNEPVLGLAAVPASNAPVPEAVGRLAEVRSP
jgi:hydroxymethylbilane synthase